MLRKSLKLLLLSLTIAGLVFAQGLNTTASKESWEEINFAFDSSILTDGFPSMLRLAELLNHNPDYKVKLVGHADYLGPDRYNDKLGLKRANAVKAFLEKYGARRGQITTRSRGEHDPRVNRKTRAARFMNRRVEMTVTNARGRVIGAGGVGDAIKALESLAKKQEECCNAILKKLDKLDEILAALHDLKAENAKLQGEIDSLKAAQEGLKKNVAEVARAPKAPPPPSTAQLAQVAEKAARKALNKQPSKFSLLGLNVGSDDQGGVTFTGKGRFFAPFKNHFAIQSEAEYRGFRGRQEGQFDIGLVGRQKNVQLGLFSSFKTVSISDYQNTGTLGQASLTADYLFSRGKVGLFASKGFLDKSLINTKSVGPNIVENTYLRTVSQIGSSWALGLWGRNSFEGNLGYLRSRMYSDRPGGTLRFIFPFADHWAFTVEGGFNETFIGPSSNGRVVAGVQFGNFLEPTRYTEVDHPVPVDIPRVRYELLTERVRTGNDAPIADAGPDLIGVAAGPITLDGSASFDPDGDPITFQWSQVAGPPVSLAGADTAKATFTAKDGQVYGFRLMVTDNQGAKSLARVSVTTKETPKVRVLLFSATPQQINRGETSTLNWQVENADQVTIKGVGSVDAKTGTTTVSPTETTVYTLTAKNGVSETNVSVSVVVQTPMPVFLRCQVTPANIVEGETASLAWQTENADQVSLSGVGGVALSGSRSVSPTGNTTYTLVATNANGSISCPLTVQVTPGTVPRILSFTASPREILADKPATLTWQVKNADEVTIEGIGQVDNNAGAVQVTPTKTAAYVLTAKNQFGQVSTNVVINVVQPAKVISFTATPVEVTGPEQSFRLAWETESATQVMISGLGPRPAKGSVLLSVRQDTTYTLVVSNAYSQATAQVTVKIVKPATPPLGQPPVAQAGPDSETFSRDFTLNGSGSSDPEGGPLTYHWRALRGGAAVLDPSLPVTRVQLSGLAGYYDFELTVTDNRGNTSTDTVQVLFRSTTLR